MERSDRQLDTWRGWRRRGYVCARKKYSTCFNSAFSWFRFFRFGTYICLIEHLALMTGRSFRTLFKRATKKKRQNYHDRWDVNRKMKVIVEGDFLYDMITGPLVAMMERFGLLDGGIEKRTVGVCGSLRSSPQKSKSWEVLARLGLQGVHTDMNVFFEWAKNYGFSCITAGSKTAYLDIYPMSWDGTRGPSDIPARVEIPPGHSIVFHGLCRDRGVSYPYESLRLFVSFVVKSIMEAAEAANKAAQTNQLERKSRQEPVALPLVCVEAEVREASFDGVLGGRRR